jgi:hypothetical protein
LRRTLAGQACAIYLPGMSEPSANYQARPYVFRGSRAKEGSDGVKVCVGDTATVVFWDDFADPAQVWSRVGELVQLVWSRWPDIADRMEADPDSELDCGDSEEDGPTGDPADLKDLPEL